MLLASGKDWLVFRRPTVFLVSLYILPLVLVLQCLGSTGQNNVKGIGFQKEHDGTIIRLENGVQQIKGMKMHLFVKK